MKLLSQLIKVLWMIAFTINSAVQFSEPGIAKSRLVFRMPSPPPGVGKPRGLGSGAGSRGNCPNLGALPPLTALVPVTEQKVIAKTGRERKVTNLWGLTVSQRPTFVFYVPYTKALATGNAEFVLQDQLENTVYRQKTLLSDTPGTIAVEIPKTIAPLEVNKAYYWSFNIYCTPQSNTSALMSPDSVWVKGVIQRNSPSSSLAKQLQLAQSTPQTQLEIYAANGYWYDAIKTLIELRRANPTDPALAADWQDLLHSIGVSKAITTAPIAN